ncbi:unnamed protein product [Durusdinium trenchii]|uniref:Uncharacterized protein n=1 Tax=Durusdinium trenchii TaxID=1381693 RepID=A0ABP0NWJ2_9DINO
MSGGRARNTASAAELCRLMRLHVGHLDEEKYRASNYEDVVTEYEELMLDILALTERPNRSALEAAATLECRTKAKSVTSGAKTAASVLRVVKRLRDLGRSSATPLPALTVASSAPDLKEGATVAHFFEWEKRVAVRMHPGFGNPQKAGLGPKEETRAEATRSRACCCSPGI